MVSQWASVKIDMDTVDWKGEPIRLTSVPAERNVSTGKIRLDPDEVAKAEIRGIARQLNIGERDVDLLLLLHAPAGPFEPDVINQKYRLNKMLFYQWKRLEDVGLGEAYFHDEFLPKRQGPVPKNLHEDMMRLQKEGVLDVDWGDYFKGKSTIVRLTDKGQALAAQLWKSIPDPYKEITLRVKEEFLPLDTKTIMAKVHKEYPAYREIYIEEDKE